MAITRVMIVDDYPLLRRSLRTLLAPTENFEVVGEASDGQEAVALAARLQPDLVLMDIAMPRMNGIVAAHRILALQDPPKIIILSMHADVSLTRQALDTGVQGVLLKIHTFEELLTAIHKVQAGQVVVSSALQALPGLAWRPDGYVKVVAGAD